VGYVERHLLPAEKVVYRAAPHWVLIGLPLSILLLAVVVVLYGVFGDSGFSTILGLGCFTMFFFITLSSAVTYFTTEFALTDRRIIAKDGLIRQRSVELLLSQVESIGVSQPLVGRVLDYGTITVVGTGGTREPFRVIAGPMELRKRVHMQISERN
jgi:uncharacterized membrane protein YdbT with pleckstrin-like domain